MEARLLADKLKVSASYLLCLTDNPLGERILDLRKSVSSRPIPLLNFSDAPHAKELLNTSNQAGLLEDGEQCIIIDRFNKSEGSLVFAVMVEDDSMRPDFNEKDIIIIDPERNVRPGNFVLSLLKEKQQIVLRKYCETDNYAFQLLTSNSMWATINVKDNSEIEILGTVIEHRRFW